MKPPQGIVIRFFDNVPPLVYLSSSNYCQWSWALGLLAFPKCMVPFCIPAPWGGDRRRSQEGTQLGPLVRQFCLQGKENFHDNPYWWYFQVFRQTEGVARCQPLNRGVRAKAQEPEAQLSPKHDSDYLINHTTHTTR